MKKRLHSFFPPYIKYFNIKIFNVFRSCNIVSQPIMILFDVISDLVLGNFLMVLLLSQILFMSLVLFFLVHGMMYVESNII